MDEFDLARLADSGLTNTASLRELARWCHDHAEETGDARYSSVARSLDSILGAWGDQALPILTADRLNEALARYLPATLMADSAEEGTRSARLLREAVGEALGHLGEDFGPDQ